MKREETQLVVLARFLSKEGKHDELLEAMQKLMAPTHQEPGNIRYELNQNISEPRRITYIEKFKDQAAFDVHMAASYLKEFSTKAPELVEESEVTFHREVLP